MFTLTLVHGLSADYLYLVEKRGLKSLMHARQADGYAKRLLAENPSYYDAYLAVGATNYILANLPTAQRFFLRLGGISGGKRRGVEQLEVAGRQGRLLKPFAKILLALIAARDQDAPRARQLLLELREEFPSNTIFSSELALLDRKGR